MPDDISYVCGIDEVGRGALAGPVTLGVCWLPTSYPLLCHHIERHPFFEQQALWEDIRDSKQCSEKTRNTISSGLAQHVKKELISASPYLIDTYGIGTCLSHMIGIAVSVYTSQTSKVYIDGKIKLLSAYNNDLIDALLRENNLSKPIPIQPTLEHDKILIERVVKGDDKYLAIALASIFAKVYRDNLMIDISLDFPQYCWNQNKGYGTAAHRQAILTFKPCIHHRLTWIKKYT